MKNFQITITGQDATERNVKKIVDSDALIGRPFYLVGQNPNYVQLTLEDCPDNYTIESVRKVFEASFRDVAIDVATFD